MLSLAFAAPTFGAFWKYWNPAFAYFLQYYSYLPLRRILSRAPSVLLTFALSGFLHDLVVWSVAPLFGYHYAFPVVTVAFILLGLLVLVTDHFQMTLQPLSTSLRATVHAGAIVFALALAVGASALVNVLGA